MSSLLEVLVVTQMTPMYIMCIWLHYGHECFTIAKCDELRRLRYLFVNLVNVMNIAAEFDELCCVENFTCLLFAKKI